MSWKVLRSAACALVLVVAGCSAIKPQLETPILSLVSVSMTSADIFNQNFIVRLHVQNPNDRSLPVKGIDYELFLEGDSFAEGATHKPFVVPANGEIEFDLPVRTNFVSSLGRLVSRLQGRKQVRYTIEGKVLTEFGMVRKIPFRQSGSVDLTTLK